MVVCRNDEETEEDDDPVLDGLRVRVPEGDEDVVFEDKAEFVPVEDLVDVFDELTDPVDVLDVTIDLVRRGLAVAVLEAA